ncbi:hypothetical protein PPACK8108_LOCUS12309 [Phakopsora pachyrhizi]|uniref:Uncharacterized protein n=1 Tax=Phakopsora pachyrhizi TaxID=170000 RepID=A0AAV0B1M5_PHAPC|nr:hypothetical protein PPACK8108_LOCUS12309 [Phakopsora pachyrhizi]
MNWNGIIKAKDPRQRAVDAGGFEEIEKSLECIEKDRLETKQKIKTYNQVAYKLKGRINKLENKAQETGRHAATVTLGLMSKFDLELWDADLDKSEKELGSGIQPIRSVEHYGVTKLEWDPGGRTTLQVVTD